MSSTAADMDIKNWSIEDIMQLFDNVTANLNRYSFDEMRNCVRNSRATASEAGSSSIAATLTPMSTTSCVACWTNSFCL